MAALLAGHDYGPFYQFGILGHGGYQLLLGDIGHVSARLLIFIVLFGAAHQLPLPLMPSFVEQHGRWSLRPMARSLGRATISGSRPLSAQQTPAFVATLEQRRVVVNAGQTLVLCYD